MKLNELRIKPEKTFIILAFIFGGILTLITPPFQTPDEISHLYRAYELSEFTLIAKKINNRSGDYIPSDIVKMVKNLNGDITYHPERKFDYKKINNYLNTTINFQKKQFADFRNTVLYSPVVYLPQTIGAAIFKMTGSPLLMIYLGRLLNLLTFILITYFAIKLTPICKWGFTLLGLMPMTIYQSASLSADATCFGISFLFIAYILNCALYKKKVTNKNLIIILILSILLALCKSAYFFIILLFFLIPVNKIGSNKKYFGIFLLILLLTVLINVFWALSLKNIYVPMVINANPIMQYFSVLNSPRNFIIASFAKFIDIKLLYSFAGNIGWGDIHLPKLLIWMFFIMLVFSCLFDENNNIFVNLKKKIIVLFTIFLNIILIHFLIYLSFNKIGDTNIIGIQGRYFIPLSPLFLLPFYNEFTKKINVMKNYWDLMALCFLIIMLLTTVFYVFKRYYIS